MNSAASHPLDDVLQRARRFREDDPDPDTRAELDDLLSRVEHDPRARAELEDRFAARLHFGTAGLRGLLGAGDNRMNRRVVAQTTAALCAELLACIADASRRGLCVGFDGRHKSREFAAEVQAVANGAGFVVHAFEAPAPTPLLAFAVRELGAAAGVMITASHNPAAYNGYKVYWDDGAQLRAPHDAAITERIAQGPAARELARLPREAAAQAGLWCSLAQLPQRYFAALAARLDPPAMAAACPRVAYSALHGVGEPFARRALALAGVDDLASVGEQAEPDPSFPTVPFPNPEEPGALDRLLALGRDTHAQLALANDPDADRLAAAAPTAAGELRALSGNELGVLLSDYLLARGDDVPTGGPRFIVTTLVSTPLAARIAEAHGARAEITLTGFKWIVQRALQRQAEGQRFVLGFEEALGYCIGDLVCDKDGIAAAAHVAQMARWHAARGRGLWQALDALYVRHGLWESRQVSITMQTPEDVRRLRDAVARLRRQPPSQLAGHTLREARDLLASPNPDGLPKSDVLVFTLQGGHRLIIRPSGTEPKLKLYLDVTEPATPATLERARVRATRLLDTLEHGARQWLEAAIAGPGD